MNDAVARSADIRRDLSFEKSKNEKKEDLVEGLMPRVMAELDNALTLYPIAIITVQLSA